VPAGGLVPDHERSTIVDAAADSLFDYLAATDHLRRAVERSISGRPADHRSEQDDRGEVRLQVDRGGHRIAWSSNDPEHDHGWLVVRPIRLGAEVIVHVSSDRAAPEIDRGIDAILVSVSSLVDD
jgi:hypothetical protein